MSQFNDISKAIEKALKKFDRSIPGLQSELYKEMLEQIKRLDTDGKRIKVTVKNLSILASIKNKLNRLILNKDYLTEVKDFAKTFNVVFQLQTDYWKSIEKKFTPKPLLKAVRNQAITDTVKSLTTVYPESIADRLTGVLRTNITTGGSYAEMAKQMHDLILDTKEGVGVVRKSAITITKDAVNQFSRQYTGIVSSDLGYEWYRYMNTEINSSRPFCQAMVENNPWFHVSQIPELLEGKYLGQVMTYTDNYDGKTKIVTIYKRTNLPHGMMAGTNPDNFFIRAGGWTCGHSIQPVAERQVPQNIKDAVYATVEYQNWKATRA